MGPALVILVAIFLSLQAILPVMSSRLSAQGTPPAPALDYDVFKTKVQPILTAPRTGNARCSALARSTSTA